VVRDVIINKPVGNLFPVSFPISLLRVEVDEDRTARQRNEHNE
jgi:hypothetical protein